VLDESDRFHRKTWQDPFQSVETLKHFLPGTKGTARANDQSGLGLC
jgi:hypothetical protein